MPTIADLNKLLEKDPGDPFVLYGLGQEYAKAKDTARAVEFYDRCIAADPLYCYAYFHKARALEAAGRIDEAKETVRNGMAASRKAQDAHALSELSGLMDELEG